MLDTLEAIKARAGKDELEKIVAHLDAEDREIFRKPFSPSSWYSCDAFARFLEADIRETAGGNEEELVKGAEAVIEKQLTAPESIKVRQAGLAGVCDSKDRRRPLHVFRRCANCPGDKRAAKAQSSSMSDSLAPTELWDLRSSVSIGDLRRKESERGFYRSDRSGAKIPRARIKPGLKQTGESITIRFRHDVLRFSVP